jgi:hypothetical protein
MFVAAGAGFRIFRWRCTFASACFAHDGFAMLGIRGDDTASARAQPPPPPPPPPPPAAAAAAAAAPSPEAAPPATVSLTAPEARRAESTLAGVA